MTRSIPRAVGVFALAAAVLVGCNRAKPTSAPASTDGPPPKGPTTANFGMGGKAKNQEPAKDGKEVMQQQGCLRCHSVEGMGGKKGKGPDLTHVAADAAHTKDWLIAYVKDPKAANPASQMPGFAGKMSDKDLDMLGDYLAGLK